MRITENNTYKLGGVIIAAFGYESLDKRRMFIKETETHYRLVKTQKLVSYRSLTTLAEARNNESV